MLVTNLLYEKSTDTLKKLHKSIIINQVLNDCSNVMYAYLLIYSSFYLLSTIAMEKLFENALKYL